MLFYVDRGHTDTLFSFKSKRRKRVRVVRLDILQNGATEESNCWIKSLFLFSIFQVDQQVNAIQSKTPKFVIFFLFFFLREVFLKEYFKKF